MSLDGHRELIRKSLKNTIAAQAVTVQAREKEKARGVFRAFD
jgi:hypothetical protein